MKPDGTTKLSAGKVGASEDTKVRKSLHVLQPAATDKENLVGAGRTLRSTTFVKDLVKNEMSERTGKVEAVKRKKSSPKEVAGKEVNHKSIQTSQERKVISPEDLTSEAGPSENYWEVIAERRRVALDDTLEENRMLVERVATLEEENRLYKDMLEESRALVEVLQEMLGEDGNGINNSLDDSAL